MPRGVPPQDSDEPKGFKPDWTEEELQEKLDALRWRKHIQAEAISQPDDISEEESEEFSEENSEDTNQKAMDLAKSLIQAKEFSELVELCKLQIKFDPQNAQFWRKIRKMAVKDRREQRPPLIRVFLLLVKIVVPILIILVILGIIGNSLPKH